MAPLEFQLAHQSLNDTKCAVQMATMLLCDTVGEGVGGLMDADMLLRVNMGPPDKRHSSSHDSSLRRSAIEAFRLGRTSGWQFEKGGGGGGYRRHYWDFIGNLRRCMLLQISHNLLMPNARFESLCHALPRQTANHAVGQEDIAANKELQQRDLERRGRVGNYLHPAKSSRSQSLNYHSIWIVLLH